MLTDCGLVSLSSLACAHAVLPVNLHVPVCAGTGMKCMLGSPNSRAGSGIHGPLTAGLR